MKLVCLIVLFFVVGTVAGQRCATDEYLNRNAMARFQSTGTGKPNLAARDTLADEVIVIPVVVHVLYNESSPNISDDRIIDQINRLSNDFRRRNADTVNTPAVFRSVAADTRIAFCLAKIDPNGYKTTGIDRHYTGTKYFLPDDQMKFSSKGGVDTWDPSRYFNIWVCDLFDRTLGYSTMPGGNPDVDGVVIQTASFGLPDNTPGSYSGGRTLTHETGHWLGLKHLWGDVEGPVCASDEVEDTPPQTGPNFGNPVFPHLSSCSDNEDGDMFMNYMDFTNDAGMNMFTNGQKDRMRSLFAAGGPRNSILGSDLCDGSGASEGPVAEEDDVQLELTVNTYPNPVTDQLVVVFKGEKFIPGGYTIELFNLNGKRLTSKKVVNKTENISCISYPDGLYLLRVTGLRYQKTVKILKRGRGVY